MFINRNVSFRRKSIDFTVITGIKLKYMKPKGDIKMNKCECEHHCHCHDAVENCECGNCKEGTCKCQDGCECGCHNAKEDCECGNCKTGGCHCNEHVA